MAAKDVGMAQEEYQSAKRVDRKRNVNEKYTAWAREFAKAYGPGLRIKADNLPSPDVQHTAGGGDNQIKRRVDG